MRKSISKPHQLGHILITHHGAPIERVTAALVGAPAMPRHFNQSTIFECQKVSKVRKNNRMTSPYVWTPLGASADEMTEFLTLRPGIPDYMQESLISWIRGGEVHGGYASTAFLLKFQTAAKTNLGIRGSHATPQNLDRLLRGMDPETFANLVHFMLSELPGALTGRLSARAQTVEDVLSSGGSSYSVAINQGRYGLVERVPAAVADTVEEVISSSGKASSLLSSAWDQAFGMNKKPSHAYSDAVKAVEVYSSPLFSPKDKLSTLGKDLNVLRNGEANFEFAMTGSQHTTAIGHVVSMMQLLWHSQTDRHGEENYVGVSVAEAQAAVLLASTLVGWFSKGMVARKTP